MERAHADQQNPLLLAVNRQREEIRAFPDTAGIVAFRSKLAGFVPVLQVVRCVEQRTVTTRHGDTPAAFLRVLEDLRVTEIGHIARNNRVAFVFMEGDVVGRPCNRLLFMTVCRVAFLLPVMGEHRNHRRLSVFTKAGSIVVVHDRRTGINPADFVRLHRNRQVLPVNQVAAHCMVPVHRSPDVVVGIILRKQVIIPVFINQTVGVIDPALFGGKVDFGTIMACFHR